MLKFAFLWYLIKIKQDEEWDKEVPPLRTEVPDQRSAMARRIKERLKQKRAERKAARKQEAERKAQEARHMARDRASSIDADVSGSDSDEHQRRITEQGPNRGRRRRRVVSSSSSSEEETGMLRRCGRAP